MVFKKAVKNLLVDEGGYVNNPADSGGETKYGISKKTYPALDIKNLTREEAIVIYFQDFWVRYGYADIAHKSIAEKLFNLSVNMGPHDAHRLVQQSLRALKNPVHEDGRLGPITKAAINSANENILLAAYRSEAAGHYRALVSHKKSLGVFLSGWLNRAYS